MLIVFCYWRNLVFSRPVKEIQAGRTIDIAFSLNVGEDGKYDFKPSKYPYISVYFPTETESKLKFIVQGPYRTTPNRSSVPADDKYTILEIQDASLIGPHMVISDGSLHWKVCQN